MEVQWFGMGVAVQWLIALGLQVALIVVAATAVRAARPEASGLFIAAACIEIFGICVVPGITMVGARLGDVEQLVMMQTMAGIVGALLHAGAFGLMLGGIVRLARPHARDPREPDAT